MLNPFTPCGTSATVSATTSSSRQPLTGNFQQVMVSVAAGGQVAFIAFGNSSVTASATSTPVLPGTTQIFSVANATHVAAITSTSTATVYATPGNGR